MKSCSAIIGMLTQSACSRIALGGLASGWLCPPGRSHASRRGLGGLEGVGRRARVLAAH